MALQVAVVEAAQRNPAYVDRLVPLSYLFGKPVGEPCLLQDLLLPTWELRDGVELVEVTPGFWAPLGETSKLLWMPASDPATGDLQPVRASRRIPSSTPSVWSDVLAMHETLRFWPTARREANGSWACRWIAREHATEPPTTEARRRLGPLRGKGRSLEDALRQLTLLSGYEVERAR
jgi:hypothetical protein